MAARFAPRTDPAEERSSPLRCLYPMDKKLLVIEDEVAILTFLRASLSESGWDVLEARTARLGLDLAAKQKPDAILLDLGLPDQDGLAALKSLRQWTSAPVI